MDIAKLAIDAWGPSVAVGIDKNSAHIDVRGRWARWTYKGVGDAAARARAKQEIDAYRRSKMAPTHGRPVPKPAAAAPAAPAAEFLKNVDELKAVALAPGEPIAVNRKWPDSEKAAAETYNRVGGLMGALATRLGVELPAVLAVWQVESGGRRHTPGKAIIRFENHLLFKFWGQTNTALYDTHFRHGGHAGQPGPSWKLYALRPSAGTPFLEMHRRGDQATEYRALELARKLAGDSIALQCISIGGPQILIANYRRLGFGTPRQMYDAFQTSERWHVIGFFDFCRTTKAPATGDMINYLRERNWERFAYYYNGKGQVANYSGHLSAAYEAARAVSVVRARESEWEEQGEAEEGSREVAKPSPVGAVELQVIENPLLSRVSADEGTPR